MVDNTIVQYLEIFWIIQYICLVIHGQWSDCNIKKVGNASIMSLSLGTAFLR
jgi:hypothetical protein